MAGPESELQKKSREHAEKISMHTLFSPIAKVEMVQAQSRFKETMGLIVVVLASWADTSGWRAGGHAVRMALDMGLYRCLPYLVRTGMGADKTPEQLKDEQPLVTGARVWLTVRPIEDQADDSYSRWNMKWRSIMVDPQCLLEKIQSSMPDVSLIIRSRSRAIVD